MAVKFGEAQSELTGDVKKTESIKVRLSVSNQDRLKEITFNPSEDLKKGDKVKITVEKL